MQLTVKTNNRRAIVRLAGRFDFNLHGEFRKAADAIMHSNDIDSVVIDLAEVDSLDSSALGMLLMLRDRATAAGKELFLASPRGTVKHALEIARFEKLFSIA